MLEGLQWPSWLGTPSQVAMVVILLVAIVKVWPLIRQLHVSSAEKMCELLTQQVATLTARLERCEETGREAEKKLLGIERNRIQEQISLINALMDGKEADSPQLARIRATLEAVQIGLGKEGADDVKGS